jgi:hypothetical protein
MNTSAELFSFILLFIISFIIFFIIFYAIITLKHYNQNMIINNRHSLIDSISKL